MFDVVEVNLPQSGCSKNEDGDVSLPSSLCAPPLNSSDLSTFSSPLSSSLSVRPFRIPTRRHALTGALLYSSPFHPTLRTMASTDRVFTFEELAQLKNKHDLHLLILGKGTPLLAALFSTAPLALPSANSFAPLSSVRDQQVPRRGPLPTLLTSRTALTNCSTPEETRSCSAKLGATRPRRSRTSDTLTRRASCWPSTTWAWDPR